MKTMEDWKGSFNEYVAPGDEVSEEIVEHFLGAVPPKSWIRGVYLQCGEPSDSTSDGLSTYDTFENRGGKWFYCGDCIRGQKEHRTDTYGARRRLREGA